MKTVYSKTPQDECRHPWGSLKRSLGDRIACRECGAFWESSKALQVIFKSADEELESWTDRIENLERALFAHLGMTCCDECGTYFPLKPRFSVHGIRFSEGGEFCAECWPERFWNDEDMPRYQIEDAARWVHALRGKKVHPQLRYQLDQMAKHLASELEWLAKTDGARCRPIRAAKAAGEG